MAKIKKEEITDENLQEGEASKNILNSILKQHKTEHYNFDERVNWKVSTGSLLLDAATGQVQPSLWRLAGNNNSGKTPQTLEIVRNIFEGVPNSKALWVLAEGRGLSQENKERCGLKFVYSPEEWDIHTVFVLETSIYELFIKVVKDLVKNNHEKLVYAFVADSINGLICREDSKKEITENSLVCGQAALSKKMMQSLSIGMFKFGHWMGLISQVTSEIKIDPYAKTANRGGSFSGGNTLLHASDVILEYGNSYNGDFILDNPAGKMNDGKTKTIGQNVKVTLIKSTLENSKKALITYPIKFGKKPSGIWREMEIGQMLAAYELVKVAGAGWMTISESLRKDLAANNLSMPEKIQGFNNLYEFLTDNPDVCEFLFNKFRDILG